MTSIPLESDPKGSQADLFRSALESVDRELAFYRSRSGQIYLVALSAEALIIVGREQIKIENVALWMVPLIVSLAFLAVAVVGTVLGAEYRRRIRQLKRSRKDLCELALRRDIHPSSEERRVSEIGVLYFVLWFTSVGGCVIAWLRTFPNRRFVSVVAISYAIGVALVACRGMWLSFRRRGPDKALEPIA
jgi:hypothetical protein